MFDLIYVSAPLNLSVDVVKVWFVSRIFLFSKVCLATIQFNSNLVTIRLSGRISHTIRPDSRIPEKNRPDSRITGYQPDIRCDPSVYTSDVRITPPLFVICWLSGKICVSRCGWESWGLYKTFSCIWKWVSAVSVCQTITTWVKTILKHC